ncbi:MAG TPA: hypothetical protein VG871_16160 [Vicinamibacterales bacterium]|nr:hypothetical protein [Vicinamibacterales bacterium]
MPERSRPSEYRFEKQRVAATVTLSSGQSTRGAFFTATGSAQHDGPERVGDLLNRETGFFPFEIQEPEGSRTVLYNRAHVVVVGLAENEEQRDAGYEVATRRFVSILLTNGQRVVGAVRVYRPKGRDRLSDWTRQPETFRYLETSDMTVLVNAAHIVDISEVPEP